MSQPREGNVRPYPNPNPNPSPNPTPRSSRSPRCLSRPAPSSTIHHPRCASALNLLATCVVHKRKLVVKQRLVPPLVLVLFEICAEIEELDEDEDELSLHKLAAQVASTY